MSVEYSSKIKRVLYHNRFCDQENFDIILSGTVDVYKHSEERKIFKLSLNDFSKVETLYNSTGLFNSDRTICERSNVWNVRLRIKVMRDNKLQIKNKFVKSFKIYLH